MSKSSHVAVRFDGGPRAGEKSETRGEPRRRVGHPGSGGHYAFAWDRDDNGVRQRTGTYTWHAASGDELVEPRSGDEASALLEHADGNATTKDGASISPVPDLTAKAAEPTLAKVHEQVAEIEREQRQPTEVSPDARSDSEPAAPKSGDAASAEAEKPARGGAAGRRASGR